MNQNALNSKGSAQAVSRKYYEDLKSRVEEIAAAVCPRDPHRLADEVMEYVGRFLCDPSAGFDPDPSFSRESDIVFMTLRADIERAVERSRQAKARAAARRRAKEDAAGVAPRPITGKARPTVSEAPQSTTGEAQPTVGEAPRPAAGATPLQRLVRS
ncbi:MAG: hypothetical protein K2K72_08480 [Duncaniella sp.]|nr:hypothetical protein [Duncaniella sp.]